jgi:hypothetical protein
MGDVRCEMTMEERNVESTHSACMHGKANEYKLC